MKKPDRLNVNICFMYYPLHFICFLCLLKWKYAMCNQDEFLEAFNHKKEKAYYQLFQQFYSYLVLFAERHVKDRKIAEDIVQELFMAVWEGSKTYNSFVGLRAYLYEAVLHRCADFQKHQLVEDKYVEYLTYEQKLGDDSVQHEEIYRELYIAINRLSEREREVLLLTLDGKSNQEIAEYLNLSILTIKTHKKNAYTHLRKQLASFI